MIPAIVDLHIKDVDSKGFRLWLPVFLLWPVVLLILVLALVLTLLVDFILLLAGQRYHHYSALLLNTLNVVSQLRGTLVNIDSDTSLVKVRII